MNNTCDSCADSRVIALSFPLPTHLFIEIIQIRQLKKKNCI